MAAGERNVVNRRVLAGIARGAAALCFFIGVFFVAQAYTMAFHGVYIDCFSGGGCGLRTYGEPTLTSALYGTVLAIAATITFYIGLRALRWPARDRSKVPS
jgi:uncharacterized membrane protein (DUF441 family)